MQYSFEPHFLIAYHSYLYTLPERSKSNSYSKDLSLSTSECLKITRLIMESLFPVKQIHELVQLSPWLPIVQFATNYPQGCRISDEWDADCRSSKMEGLASNDLFYTVQYKRTKVPAILNFWSNYSKLLMRFSV